jgi:hypothetical protein
MQELLALVLAQLAVVAVQLLVQELLGRFRAARF